MPNRFTFTALAVALYRCHNANSGCGAIKQREEPFSGCFGRQKLNCRLAVELHVWWRKDNIPFFIKHKANSPMWRLFHPNLKFYSFTNLHGHSWFSCRGRISPYTVTMESGCWNQTKKKKPKQKNILPNCLQVIQPEGSIQVPRYVCAIIKLNQELITWK